MACRFAIILIILSIGCSRKNPNALVPSIPVVTFPVVTVSAEKNPENNCSDSFVYLLSNYTRYADSKEKEEEILENMNVIKNACISGSEECCITLRNDINCMIVNCKRDVTETEKILLREKCHNEKNAMACWWTSKYVNRKVLIDSDLEIFLHLCLNRKMVFACDVLIEYHLFEKNGRPIHEINSIGKVVHEKCMENMYDYHACSECSLFYRKSMKEESEKKFVDCIMRKCFFAWDDTCHIIYENIHSGTFEYSKRYRKYYGRDVINLIDHPKFGEIRRNHQKNYSEFLMKWKEVQKHLP